MGQLCHACDASPEKGHCPISGCLEAVILGHRVWPWPHSALFTCTILNLQVLIDNDFRICNNYLYLNTRSISKVRNSSIKLNLIVLFLI